MPSRNLQKDLSVRRLAQKRFPEGRSIRLFPGLDRPDQKLRAVWIFLGQGEQFVDIRLPIPHADQHGSGMAFLDFRDRLEALEPFLRLFLFDRFFSPPVFFFSLSFRADSFSSGVFGTGVGGSGGRVQHCTSRSPSGVPATSKASVSCIISPRGP